MANKKAFLFPGGDGASLGIAKNYDLLSKRFFLMCTTDPNVLIKVTDKKNRYEKEFDEEKEEIKNKLLEKKRTEIYEKLKAELKEQYSVK